MMHTEEQAQKKSCCAAWPCGVPDDTGEMKSKQRLCVGPICMAWRWSPVEDGFDLSTAELLQKRPDLEKWHNPADTSRTFKEPTGFCGLAGYE